MRSAKNTAAFSLVELSIVLVILGLLVGGVLSGRSLIRAAEIRNITVEFQQWQTAVNTFRGKYNALPGDMRNATSFWGNASNGAMTGECTNALNASGSGKQTCNGNGDGKIGSYDGSSTLVYVEWMRFWQHLSNAGLIEGSYKGVPSSGTPGDADFKLFGTGDVIPASKVGGAAWSVYHAEASGWESFEMVNYMVFGSTGELTSSPPVPLHGVITPEEAWGIDTKFDDGNPGMGSVRSAPMYPAAAQRCWNFTGSQSYSWENVKNHTQYALSNTANNCSLWFKL